VLHISLAERDDLSGEIYRQTRRTIVAGALRPKDRLPSSRELAETLNVARATVVIAYERLAGEGFIETVQGAGTFVTASSPPVRQYIDVPQRHALEPRPIWETIPLPTAFDHPAEFDFRTGLPDASLFPHQRWRRLIAQALRANEVAGDAAYGSPAGHPDLRASIARHIGVSRGISASADDVIVTNGTQQAIDLLSRVLLSPGDRVAVEDPGYEAPRRAFEAAGARVIGVPVDGEGLIVDALPTDVKAVYVTPSHQYPLTITMTLARRRALLDWADRNDAAIIEDDYEGEFRFHGRPLEALQTLDTNGRAIYVGSFSKTLLPTLRLGFVVVPPNLRLAVRKAKYVSDWSSSTLEQAALSRFIEEGSFARHVRRASRVYHARHQMIAETIVTDFAEHLDLIPSTTGIHLAAMARSASIDEIAEVTARAAEIGVQVHRLSSFAVGHSPRAGLVLGYGAVATSRIQDGLRRLRSCF
jgi:GntR family transcriptional regulator / MocR family aminotransferase